VTWRINFIAFQQAAVSIRFKVQENKGASAMACNDLLLFAPQQVIEALRAFQDQTRVSHPNKSKEKHDELLSKLLFEMRADLGVNPKDDPNTFPSDTLGFRRQVPCDPQLVSAEGAKLPSPARKRWVG
jgi:hypothetical protein